jgi:riboflavin synthase
MFTGIVAERGRLVADPAPSGQGGVRLVIEHSPELGARLSIGASLAVSGVCLTVTRLEGEPATRSTVELSPETLARTTLGELRGGGFVNLETALRVGEPLGGHWVQGHVDDTTFVMGRRDLADHCVMSFAIPPGMEPYLVFKGSVTLDGVSLTVAALRADRFDVALVPHTLEVTTLGLRAPGDRVNLEVDVLAKYIERILTARGLVAETAGAGTLQP